MALHAGEIYMEGFLIKRGHMRHNWKTRWFKLSDSSLRYYKSQTNPVPLGRIQLDKAILLKTNVFATEDTEDKDRQNVFKVTTETGVEYPIQAATLSEFEIWTDAIQSIIDKTDPKTSTVYSRSPANTALTEAEIYDSLHMHRHAETFSKMRSAQGGVRLEARTIDGVHYAKGVSGDELQRWIWKNMGLTGKDSENSVKGLVRLGLLDCVTSELIDPPFAKVHYYRMLAEEESLKSMSSTYINSISSHMENPSSSNKKEFKTKLSKSPKHHAGGLPADLPPGDVIKKGILFKRGHVVLSWKARCFVLQEFPATLSYFDPSKKNPKVLNKLSLYGATVFAVEKVAAEVALSMENPPENMFCLKTQNETIYLMIASSKAERREWVTAIRSLCRKSANSR